jgi:hypothetical protein
MHRWWRVIETTHQEENDMQVPSTVKEKWSSSIHELLAPFLFVLFFNSPTGIFFFFRLFRLHHLAQLLVLSSALA